MGQIAKKKRVSATPNALCPEGDTRDQGTGQKGRRTRKITGQRHIETLTCALFQQIAGCLCVAGLAGNAEEDLYKCCLLDGNSDKKTRGELRPLAATMPSAVNEPTAAVGQPPMAIGYPSTRRGQTARRHRLDISGPSQSAIRWLSTTAVRGQVSTEGWIPRDRQVMSAYCP